MLNFVLTSGVACYLGQNIKTARHTHHALEFIFGIDQPFDLIADETEFRGIYGVVIHPNHPHRFIGGQGQYLFIYLEPELSPVQQINNHYDLPVKKVVRLNRLSAFPDTATVIDFTFFTELLNITITPTSVSKTDPRIISTVEFIKNDLARGQLSADLLAENIHLSTSRFCHLFKEQIGIPVRRYILWCRIQGAAKELIKGSNFTKAAHAAGFSDSAHFSRTFMEMFGVSPSAVLKR